MKNFQAQNVRTDKVALFFIILLSLLIFTFLIWWIYFKPVPLNPPAWSTKLSSVNALLNTLTSIFLISGYRFIKKSKILAHRNCMFLATMTSAGFLISYLIYHHYQGDTPFQGVGFIRYVYFFILISHIILSIVQVPCILSTLYFAFRGNFVSHKKIARWTFPIWLYVSITGVLIYFFLN